MRKASTREMAAAKMRAAIHGTEMRAAAPAAGVHPSSHTHASHTAMASSHTHSSMTAPHAAASHAAAPMTSATTATAAAARERR